MYTLYYYYQIWFFIFAWAFYYKPKKLFIQKLLLCFQNKNTTQIYIFQSYFYLNIFFIAKHPCHHLAVDLQLLHSHFHGMFRKDQHFIPEWLETGLVFRTLPECQHPRKIRQHLTPPDHRHFSLNCRQSFRRGMSKYKYRKKKIMKFSHIISLFTNSKKVWFFFRYTNSILMWSLLPNSGFVLNLKCSREMLQNLPYFIYVVYENPKVALSDFHFVLLYFFPLLIACRHRPVHSIEEKIK